MTAYRDGVAARNRIWLLVVVGFVLGIIGGWGIAIGFGAGSAGVFLLGYVAAGLGSAFLFVGLVAAGVSLGLNASKL